MRLRKGNQANRAAVSLIVLASFLIVTGFFFLYWPYAFEKTLLKKKSPHEKIKMLSQTQIIRRDSQTPSEWQQSCPNWTLTL
jgi:hypothetical protein